MKFFTKTWRNDLVWLAVAIRSVQKYCREPVVDWTIVCDDGERPLVAKMLAETIGPTPQGKRGPMMQFTVHEVREHWPECAQIPRGYEVQQWVKMNAHRVLGSVLHWHYDSDVLCIREFSRADFIGPSGRPIYWITPLEQIVDAVNQPVYQQRAEVLKQIFGLPDMAFEWARCLPLPASGEILRQGSLQREWRTFFDLCVASDRSISEFNVMGLYANLHFPDAYEWRNTQHHACTWMSHPGNEPLHLDGWKAAMANTKAQFFQGWSWGGMPPGVVQWAAGL